MIIFVDKRIPEIAIQKLQEYGQPVLFETSGITYDAISGHPDIFFCKIGEKLVTASNLPIRYKEILTKNSISFVMGSLPVGSKYPATAYYNAVVTDNLLIHNLDITDYKIKIASNNLDTIHVEQGYCRCNLLPLKNNAFITSDEGIFKVLSEKEMNVQYVKPNGISLSGFENGFFGGTCGVYEDKVFFIGSLNHYTDGDEVRQFLKTIEYKIVELYDGPLIDGGSLIFLDKDILAY